MIRRCKRTFVIDSGYGIPEYLETLCPEVTELGTLYEPGTDRLPTYRRMAAEVVSAAVADAPVCLATYGHPWVYCYPTTLITRAAPLLGLHVEVFPGVSSFDTLLVDLGTDIALNGIQMYEATDLLLRRRPIQSDVTCVIWQPTVVGDPTYRPEPYTAEQFEPLQDYLLRFYPAEHEVAIVTTQDVPADALGRAAPAAGRPRGGARAGAAGRDALHPAARRAAGRGRRAARGDADGGDGSRRRVMTAAARSRHSAG